MTPEEGWRNSGNVIARFPGTVSDADWIMRARTWTRRSRRRRQAIIEGDIIRTDGTTVLAVMTNRAAP